MRRLLACAVATELVLGGFGVAALRDTPGAQSVAAGRIAAIESREAAGEAGNPGLPARPVHTSGGRPEPAGASQRAGAARGDVLDGTGDRHGQISFKPPRDFATFAEPSAAAFNRASGDQMGQQLAHAVLPDAVAVGDFDGDGDADVAQTNVIAGSVSIFLGDGRGGFGTPAVQYVGVHPSFIVAALIDPDVHLDLAVANTGSDNVTILRGDGDGSFLPSVVVPVPAPRNVAIARLDDDDVPDLAVASAGPACARLAPECVNSIAPAGGVATFVGTAAPAGGVSFAPSQFIPLTQPSNGRPVGANYVAVGDFDGNGADDLAVAAGVRSNAGDRDDNARPTGVTGDDLLVFGNRGPRPTGLFDLEPDQTIRVGGTPEAIEVDDWNGDSHPDLAVASNASGDVVTLLGDGAGHFAVKATNRTTGTLARSMAAGDFDDDGILDLVTANFGASTISVLRGNDGGAGQGDGTFQPAVDFWAGDATTAVAVGHFDNDERLDVVAARLRTDQLSLLVNDSQQPGDGVVIDRDIPYIDSPNDPFAAHHDLDVYIPPPSATSFAGKGKPYPVVFFAHAGGGISLDKAGVNYLMRSLAREGLVAVSTNYRLGVGIETQQLEDVIAAFGWTRDNIGSKRYGGDPADMFAFGYSTGATFVAKLATESRWAVEQQHLRGFILAGTKEPRPGDDPTLLPSLLLSGDEGLERGLSPASTAFSSEAQRRGAASRHVVVTGRDHLTLVSDMAVTGDQARDELLAFMRQLQ